MIGLLFFCITYTVAVSLCKPNLFKENILYEYFVDYNAYLKRRMIMTQIKNGPVTFVMFLDFGTMAPNTSANLNKILVASFLLH